MKRTTLMAALTGATVLLAGCSSTSGTAAPASTSSATSAASVSSSSMSSAMAAASQASSSGAPSSSAAASITEPSTSAASSETASSDTASSEATTSSDDSSSGTASSASSTSSSSKLPTTTVGNNSAGLDAQSAAWLSAFCTGFTPIVGQTKTTATSLASSDPTKIKAGLVKLYGSFGSIFNDTAAKLKPLDPPSFSGGSAFATKLITALEKSAPIFLADAKRVSAIDAKTNSAAIVKEASALPKALQEAAAPLDELDALKLTPQTEAAFEKLPACAKLNSTG